MQFSAKIHLNNRFLNQTQGLVPPSPIWKTLDPLMLQMNEMSPVQSCTRTLFSITFSNRNYVCSNKAHSLIGRKDFELISRDGIRNLIYGPSGTYFVLVRISEAKRDAHLVHWIQAQNVGLLTVTHMVPGQFYWPQCSPVHQFSRLGANLLFVFILAEPDWKWKKKLGQGEGTCIHVISSCNIVVIINYQLFQLSFCVNRLSCHWCLCSNRSYVYSSNKMVSKFIWITGVWNGWSIKTALFWSQTQLFRLALR